MRTKTRIPEGREKGRRDREIRKRENEGVGAVPLFGTLEEENTD